MSAASIPVLAIDPLLIHPGIARLEADIKSTERHITQYKKLPSARRELKGGEAYFANLHDTLTKLNADLEIAKNPTAIQRPPRARSHSNSIPVASSDDEPEDPGPNDDIDMDPPLHTAEEIAAMRISFAENLHPKALTIFPVGWPLVGQRIQSAVDGKASARDTATLSEAWKKLQLWGNMTCAGGFGVVADVIGWKDTIDDRGANWAEALSIYQWLAEAVKGLRDQKTHQSKSDIFKIWDYAEGAYTEFTNTMAVQAREDAARWLGSIESGREVAIHMLTNRSGKTKCITCHHSARGSNKPKHGDGLRGDGEDYLDCRCPVDSSLLEAFILKVCRKAYPDFPYRPLSKNDEDGGFPHSDFAFNPVTLGLVERIITDLTGLAIDQLLQQRESRLLSVISSATDELYAEYMDNPDIYPNECRLVKKFKDRVYFFEKDLTALQEENELPGGKPKFQAR